MLGSIDGGDKVFNPGVSQVRDVGTSVRSLAYHPAGSLLAAGLETGGLMILESYRLSEAKYIQHFF